MTSLFVTNYPANLNLHSYAIFFEQGVGSVYGCPAGPFMDDSLICKAGIISGAITDKTGGIVNFMITKPSSSVNF